MKQVYIVAFINLQDTLAISTNDVVFNNYEEAFKYCIIQNEYWKKIHEKNNETPQYRYFINNITLLRTKALINEEPAE